MHALLIQKAEIFSAASAQLRLSLSI